jgi:hypothetical protein
MIFYPNWLSTASDMAFPPLKLNKTAWQCLYISLFISGDLYSPLIQGCACWLIHNEGNTTLWMSLEKRYRQFTLITCAWLQQLQHFLCCCVSIFQLHIKSMSINARVCPPIIMICLHAKDVGSFPVLLIFASIFEMIYTTMHSCFFFFLLSAGINVHMRACLPLFLC